MATRVSNDNKAAWSPEPLTSYSKAIAARQQKPKPIAMDESRGLRSYDRALRVRAEAGAR